jgi:hypothetical protein
MPPPTVSENGQASVEMLAALPFVLLVGAVAWQLTLAGWTAWMSAHAARVAARADAVGRPPEAAARSALPAPLRPGLRVRRRSSGGVEVRVRVPTLFDRATGPIAISARSSLGRADR